MTPIGSHVNWQTIDRVICGSTCESFVRSLSACKKYAITCPLVEQYQNRITESQLTILKRIEVNKNATVKFSKFIKEKKKKTVPYDIHNLKNFANRYITYCVICYCTVLT
ncbi:hypothetical protein PUN28_003431 [Cardiocondyla obscurior]|uniref:Uncharacterized protein n=1 Tax=Cardiocondyla obscurior TaxID=286306 RepID=A0AAW2GL24_9HYME